MKIPTHRITAALCITLGFSLALRAQAQPLELGSLSIGEELSWQGATSTATGPIPGTSAGTLTGVLIVSGDRVTVTASGTVNTLPPDSGSEGGPNGNPSQCTPACQLPSAHFGALIGKIGPDGPWFLVGASRVITANRTGILILGVNDTINDNNTGQFNVTVSVVGTTSPCVSGPTTLCLMGGRFQVDVAWRAPSGQAGFGGVASCGTSDSGLFWFFSPSNWEMLVKMVNGCGLNARYWVFMAATTNVEFTLRVEDTETGVIQQYFNPLNRQAPPLADTSAFATCP
jgi:hypothetical protein